jgi:hypothetical protein
MNDTDDLYEAITGRKSRGLVLNKTTARHRKRQGLTADVVYPSRMISALYGRRQFESDWQNVRDLVWPGYAQLPWWKRRGRLICAKIILYCRALIRLFAKPVGRAAYLALFTKR